MERNGNTICAGARQVSRFEFVDKEIGEIDINT